MKKSLKTKPVKTARRSKLPTQPSSRLESNPIASSTGYNPTVCLKLNGSDIFKIDLWTLVLVYAPKEAMMSHNSLKLFIDDREVKEVINEANTGTN